MAERARETFLGLDIGTSSVKALLVDVEQRVLAEASIPLNVSRPQPCGASRTLPIGSRESRPRSPRSAATLQSDFAELSGIGLSGQMHGATLLDAAGQTAQTRDLMERRAVVRRMRRAQAARPRSRAAHRQSRHARLHRAENAVGRRARARNRQGDEARAVAQGLCAPAPLGRGGVRNVRRLGHALARCRTAALGRHAACGDGPDREGHAEPGRGFGGFRLSRAGNRRRLGTRGAQGSDCRRGRRQRRLGDRRWRHGARGGLRFARHVGRHLFGHRPFRSASPSGRCTRFAMRCRIAGTAWR